MLLIGLFLHCLHKLVCTQASHYHLSIPLSITSQFSVLVYFSMGHTCPLEHAHVVFGWNSLFILLTTQKEVVMWYGFLQKTASGGPLTIFG